LRKGGLKKHLSEITVFFSGTYCKDQLYYSIYMLLDTPSHSGASM